MARIEQCGRKLQGVEAAIGGLAPLLHAHSSEAAYAADCAYAASWAPFGKEQP